MERKKCEVFELDIEYLETKGTGDTPLVILHGWGSQAERWSEVMAILEQNEVRVIAIDLPGFGYSDVPSEPWGIENYAQFTTEFLKRIKAQKFYLLGHSFGGRIVTKIAANRLSGLMGIILVNSAGVTPRNQARISIYKLATKIAKLFFSIPLLNNFKNIARKIIYKVSGSYDYYLQNGAMKETFKKVIEEDLTPYLSSIQVPTSIIWGRHDKMTPVSDAYIINRQIKNSKLIIIENGNHSLNLQMPERLAKEIINFL